MRIIPKSTKIKFRFYKSITIADVLIGLLSLFLVSLALTSNLQNRFTIATIILMVVSPLFITFDEVRLYSTLFDMFKFLFSAKSFKIKSRDNNTRELLPYKQIEDSLVKNKDKYYFGVVKINPIDLHMLDELKQNYLIDNVLAMVFKSIGMYQNCDLVKLEQPLVLNNYLQNELGKIDNLIKAKENKQINEKEFETRINIIEDRITIIDEVNSKNKIKYPVFYLVLHDLDKSNLQTTLNTVLNSLNNNGLKVEQLKEKELFFFLNYSVNSNFTEEGFVEGENTFDLKNLIPKKVKFGLLHTKQNNQKLTHFVISDYPLKVGNAWAEGLFGLENTKVIVKLKPVDKYKAIKRVDNAMAEVSGTQNSNKASYNLGKQTHLESLQILLESLQNEDETFFDTTIIVTVYDEPNSSTNKKGVKTALRKFGFRFNEMIGKQAESFVSSSLSVHNKVAINRGLNSNIVSASFPFVSDTIMDENGLLIGENSLPVFVDFFKRDNERVNSNMVIIGKSGSGKSFATKTLLTHMASDNAKVFILDPENEYGTLAKNLKGKVLDVSSSHDGRINPFHIIKTLDDENQDGTSNSFFSHLQFLEEFFRLILIGINADSLELLNKIILEVYIDKNINAYTNLNELKANDYPIFEDLVNLIEAKLKIETDEYNKSCLKILTNYLSKFKKGGRNSSLWNGQTTFDPQENFVCFNFQKLLANKNNIIANAQMLLVLKWLDNEVIKNRDYNTKHKADRKIVVAIDEAHIFIDEKHQVALDFMHQLAKRIRKYNGSLIVITQNVKDFVGSKEIERKSSAIINVSQYSLIFSLPPNDMADLVKLYEKAGQINESETNNIINLNRGSAFLISSPNSRTNVNIFASDYVRDLFE